MRIDRISVKNFRGFEKGDFEFPAQYDAHGKMLPGSFHLFVGDNATGKTALLEALAVALAGYVNFIPDAGKRHILKADVRVTPRKFEADTARYAPNYPVKVNASGVLFGEEIEWTRSVEWKRTTRAGQKKLRSLVERGLNHALHEHGVLPLVSYFGTRRNSDEPRASWMSDLKATDEILQPASIQEMDEVKVEDLGKMFASQLAGYWYCIDSRTTPRLLKRWMLLEQQLVTKRGSESAQYRLVKDAIARAIPHCKKVEYDPRFGLGLIMEEQKVAMPFDMLSDGQRSMATMVGEIAWKAAQLNPVLGEDVFLKTPGVVLIDELDLHLHPSWQRRVVNDLRQLFPQIQFIATTHSPIIVQSMRAGEVRQLSRKVGMISNTENQTLETIATKLLVPAKASADDATRAMGVKEPEVGAHYGEGMGIARELFDLIAKLDTATPSDREDIERRMALVMERVRSYPDNPAFQAFLEMKRHEALKG